jgi:hypothetical protein
MSKNSLWILFILWNFYAFAQTKGVVVDEFGKPIPYVNIWVENENIATTSEENGEFSIAVSENKNLIFSILGFEKKTVNAANAKQVTMSAVSFVLTEVVVSRRKQTKELEIGKIPNAIFESFDNGPRIDVKYFPYLASYKKTKYIKKVILLTDNRIEKATIKIHFYGVDDRGFPGDELLKKEFIVSVDKGVLKTRFDVTDFNLVVPKNGLFVGVEKLLIDKNKIEKTNTNTNTKQTSIQKKFAPFVLYNFVESDLLFTFSGGKWSRQSNEDSSKNKAYEPAINLLLTN